MASGNAADHALLRFVTMEIRTGTRRVEIPHHLLEDANDAAFEEARQLARVSGVELVVRG